VVELVEVVTEEDALGELTEEVLDSALIVDVCVAVDGLFSSIVVAKSVSKAVSDAEPKNVHIQKLAAFSKKQTVQDLSRK